jgi:hypothetical protein
MFKSTVWKIVRFLKMLVLFLLENVQLSGLNDEEPTSLTVCGVTGVHSWLWLNSAKTG